MNYLSLVCFKRQLFLWIAETIVLTDGYKGYSKLSQLVKDKKEIDKIFLWVHTTTWYENSYESKQSLNQK